MRRYRNGELVDLGPCRAEPHPRLTALADEGMVAPRVVIGRPLKGSVVRGLDEDDLNRKPCPDGCGRTVPASVRRCNWCANDRLRARLQREAEQRAAAEAAHAAYMTGHRNGP